MVSADYESDLFEVIAWYLAHDKQLPQLSGNVMVRDRAIVTSLFMHHICM